MISCTFYVRKGKRRHAAGRFAFASDTGQAYSRGTDGLTGGPDKTKKAET